MDKPTNEDGTSNRSMKHMKCNFKLYSFEIRCGDFNATVNILGIESSLFVWVGKSALPALDELSVGLVDAKGEALSMRLLGAASADPGSQSMASRLTKQLKKEVFVALNQNLDRLTTPMVEKALIQKIKTLPSFI